jgi:hypothetical protein
MRYRYERKYLVPNAELDRLRARIQPFVINDPYAPQNQHGIGQYTVRSVYFDTPTFASLYDKWEGYEVRRKLRIRGYDAYAQDNKVFLEVKRKIGDRIWKTRAHVPYKSLQELLTMGFSNGVSKDITGHNESEARKFLFNLHRYAYKPVNLITYDREPFQGKFEPGLRITFDKNIRARLWPQLAELYSEAGLRLVWQDHFILEVKYFGEVMPSWIRYIIQEFGLRHEALSKFATPFSNRNISVYNIKLGA